MPSAFISSSPNESSWLISQAGIVESYLVSPSGRYWLIMQTDGRLALYEGDSIDDRENLVWSVNGAPGLGRYFLNMQNDGNLAVWSGDPTTPDHKADGWTSETPFGAGNYFLIVQDDGNVVVYKGTGPKDSCGALWSRFTGRIVAPATEDRIAIAHADLPPCSRVEWRQVYNAKFESGPQTATLYLYLDRNLINQAASEINECVKDAAIAALLAGIFSGGAAAVPAAQVAFSACLAKKGIQNSIIAAMQFHLETQCHYK